MRRASEAQRQRLHQTFAELCRIESPSGDERACADWVARELEAIGLAVEEDDAGAAAAANAGNLLVRIPGGAGEGERQPGDEGERQPGDEGERQPGDEGDRQPGDEGDRQPGDEGERQPPSIMLCAHLDTVPATGPIEPVVVDGGWTNANPTILGADNKAAVAVLLELARGVVGSAQPQPAGVELVFTVSEENGLHGAKAFDVSKLRSSIGFVFDHASPIGEIVIASPTYHRLEAEFGGRAAHAGLRPEDGRSAIAAAARAIGALPLGRLDEETTCNVGTIAGGTAANVVPERCQVTGEARSLSDQRVEEVVTAMVDAFQDAADAGECDLDVRVQRMFSGYRVKTRERQVEVAERALAACGYTPAHILTGGGSDANAFVANGFPCLNLANGTERNHEPAERVSVDALEGMLEVAFALVREAVADPGAV